jgi:hypothetical protein
MYSFNLGDGPVSAVSQTPCTMKEWHIVEIRRSGRDGTLNLNDEDVGYARSEGEMDTLSLTGDYYLGGHPSNEPPFVGMRAAANFSGCLKDVTFGPDKADLDSYSEAVNIKRGCVVEVSSKTHFQKSSTISFPTL